MTTQSSPRTRGKQGWAVLAGICLLSLLAALLVFDQQIETWGDNAEYIILARSIVQGRWMQLINRPDSPPSYKFPFGFPLLLAGIESVAPGSMQTMKGLVLCFYVATMPLMYLLMRRYTDPQDEALSLGSVPGCIISSRQALGMTLLCLLNPLLLSFSHQVMTEVPFLFFSVLALLAIERGSDLAARPGRRMFLAALAFLCLGLWVRTVGLALFAGAFLYYTGKRQFLRACAVAVACLAALTALQALGGGLVGSSYLVKVSQLNPDMPELGAVGLWGLVGPHRLLGNLQKYILEGYVSTAILPLPSGHFVSLFSQKWLSLMNLGVIAMLVAGWWRHCSERPLVPLYSLCYFGLLFFAPARSASPRYVIPVIPFLLLFLMKGLGGCGRLIDKWLRRPSQPRLLLASFACVFSLYLYVDYSIMAARQDLSPRWKSYFEAAEWLKQHTPRESVIAGSSDHLLYLVSLRRTIGFLKSTNAPNAVAHLTRYKVDFVVVDETFVSMRYVTPIIGAYPQQFELVYATRAVPTTYILRVRRGQGTDGGQMEHTGQGGERSSASGLL